MLTRLRLRNFKRFREAEIELGEAVVLIGPNNSGKTTALQALALWDIGLRRWNEKREGKDAPSKRSGVAINRRDLLSIPVPDATLLWRELHVREGGQALDSKTGRTKQTTQHVNIDVIVEGVTNGRAWTCGLEFDYANDESFYCRPLRLVNGNGAPRMEVPSEAAEVRMAYLPPMSGLAAVEPKWEPGRINVLLGEGQTAQVLRNLCFQIHSQNQSRREWDILAADIERLFGVRLLAPTYISERGEITMAYQERNGLTLDLSSSGRGLQQTLLLLAHLYANPRSVLLLDEPDAHLEILRQSQIYQSITDVARKQESQVIAASHSEVVLNAAADRDMLISFVGQPHRVNDRGSQLAKALKEISFDQYYQAEQTGWVLYLEGSTDLAILQSFARTLGHPAVEYLEKPFVRTVGNQPNEVRKHFFGLRESHPSLVGVALFDRLERELPDDLGVVGLMWSRKEIENYLCDPETLIAYATRDQHSDPLFAQQQKAVMSKAMNDIVPPIALRDRKYPWWSDNKATDGFLDPLFARYFSELGLPNLMRKSGYHTLANLIPRERVDPEVIEKLDAIVQVARRATPRVD